MVDDAVQEMKTAVDQLTVGQVDGEWRYVNLGPVIDEIERIAAGVADPSIFLPVLAKVRQQAKDQIDDRWTRLQFDRRNGIPSKPHNSEWGKLQSVLQSGTQPIIRGLVGITGAAPDYVDSHYEPEHKPSPPGARATPKPEGKKRWWKN